MGDGDIVLIPRGMLHRTAGKGANRFLISFSEGFLSRFFTKEATAFLRTGKPLVFHPDEAHADQLMLTFNTLLSEFQKAGATSGTEADSTLAGYLYQILFTITHTSNLYVPESYTDDRVAQVIQHINENYSQIGDIEEIATRFFISKFHLCRIFNKNLGIPLITYLNTIKIREACRMMKAGNCTLTEIAMKCGFNSSSYFCKVFKNEKGLSPTEDKRQLKNTK
jgi:AraC-like DNA-binding protein